MEPLYFGFIQNCKLFLAGAYPHKKVHIFGSMPIRACANSEDNAILTAFPCILATFKIECFFLAGVCPLKKVHFFVPLDPWSPTGTRRFLDTGTFPCILASFILINIKFQHFRAFFSAVLDLSRILFRKLPKLVALSDRTILQQSFRTKKSKIVGENLWEIRSHHFQHPFFFLSLFLLTSLILCWGY